MIGRDPKTFAASTALTAHADVGEDCTVWNFAHLCRDAKISDDCTIGEAVHIGPRVVVGSGCKIQNGAQLFEGVTLEDDVFIGPHVVFTNVKIPRAFISRRREFKPTLVKRGASIGANATILCGITIGEYAMVAAGAVVTKNVEPYTLVGGVPPRFMGRVCRCGERLGDSLYTFNNPGPSTRVWSCNSCGARYNLSAITNSFVPIEGATDAPSSTTP